jgi:hypothetical protein
MENVQIDQFKVDPPSAFPRTDDEIVLQFLRDGFVVLPGILNQSECAQIKAEMEAVVAGSTGEQRPGKPVQAWRWPKERRAEHISIVTERLSYLDKILGAAPQHMRSWIRLSPPHGRGTAWHKDHDALFVPMPIIVGIAIDTISFENGGTHLIPQTQHLPHPVYDFRSYPQEQVLSGPPGTIVLFQAGVWHRGGDNQTDMDRWMLFCEFGTSSMGRATIEPTEFQKQVTEYCFPIEVQV